MIEPFKTAVTGIGAVTSQGSSIDRIWEAVCSGRSGISTMKGFSPETLPVEIGGEVFYDDISAPAGNSMSLANVLLIHAAEEALESAGLNQSRPGFRMGIHIASPSVLCKSVFKTIRESMEDAFTGQDMLDMGQFNRNYKVNIVSQENKMPLYPVTHLARKYGFKGDFFNVAVACASGTQTIHSALNSLYLRNYDAVLVGAVSTSVDPYYLCSMDRLGALAKQNGRPEESCRPFDLNRSGLVMAEGAAALVLEKKSTAIKRNTRIHGCIGGTGISSDGYHPTAPSPDCRGMIASMEKALASAGCQPGEIDYINAHGTGTHLNDSLETASVKKVFEGHLDDLLISSTKSSTGHLFTTAGLLEAIFSILACRDGMVPPTLNYQTPDPKCDLKHITKETVKTDVTRVLSNSFGFGGQNASLVVGKHETP